MLCRLMGYTGGDRAVRGMRESGSKQRTRSDDGVTAAAGDTRAGELQGWANNFSWRKHSLSAWEECRRWTDGEWSLSRWEE